jgi:hypothetical protein
VRGARATALWDTGAESNFLSASFVEQQGWSSLLTPSTQQIKYADDRIRPAVGEITLPVQLPTRGGTYNCRLRFIVANLQPRFDIVLGTTFCAAHQPRPDWETMTIALRRQGVKGKQPIWDACVCATAAPTVHRAMAISVTAMEQLWADRQLELDSLHCVNVRQLARVQLNAVHTPPDKLSDEERAERARCAELRAQTFREFAHVFPEKLPDVTTDPPASGVVHKIQLKEGAEPYSRPLRRMSTQELDELKKQLQGYLEDGRLRPSESPWGTNVIFAKKKDGTLRFCVDYRGLNDLTVRNSYPLPHMDELFDRLQGASYYSKIDLRTGFYQIALHAADMEKTAFRTRYGHFEWTVLPMGLTNAPATFQHLMNKTFRQFLDRCVLVFLDDIVVYSRTLDDHLRDVRAVLQQLAAAGLYAKQSKCDLFMHEIEFLGHHVGRNGLRVMADKVQAVQDWPAPRNAGDVRSFLGLAGYYRRFVEGFSRLAAPLHELTHTADGQVFEWKAEHQSAFDTLKRGLKGAPVLALPDPDQPYVLNTDASDFATGAVLQQDQGRGLQPIAYLSHKMSPAETRYPTHDKEMLAIIHALTEWRTYLQGRQPFTVRVRTDHNSLQYFMTQPSLSARQARWLDKLADFDFKIEYVKGPTNVVADALSRRSDHTGQPVDERVATALLALETQGSVSFSSQEWAAMPYFDAPSGHTLLANARRVSERLRAAPPLLPAEARRQADIREATLSHDPAPDRPAPDKAGTIRMPSQQCTAFTRQERRCNRRTLRGQHCATHMRLIDRLAIRKSLVPDAGLGIFVASGKGALPFQRGQRIALYTGDWVQILPGRRGDRIGGAYFLQINQGLAVDAARTNTGLGRWANAPLNAEQPNGVPLRANAELVPDHANKQGALKALRDIQPGEEILVNYGAAYWRFHRAQHGGGDAEELAPDVGQALAALWLAAAPEEPAGQPSCCGVRTRSQEAEPEDSGVGKRARSHNARDEENNPLRRSNRVKAHKRDFYGQQPCRVIDCQCCHFPEGAAQEDRWCRGWVARGYHTCMGCEVCTDEHDRRHREEDSDEDDSPSPPKEPSPRRKKQTAKRSGPPSPKDPAALVKGQPLGDIDRPGYAPQVRTAAATDAAYQAMYTAVCSEPRDGLSVEGDLLHKDGRLVIPADAALRTLLLSEAHDAASAGHTGVAGTLDRLRTRVYWAGMHADVHDYVVSCDSCQRMKVEQRKTAGLLRPPPVPDEPGYALNMDFVFGLPRTARGHTGYLSMTCRLSNWLQIALCTEEVGAEGAAQLVFDGWVRHYGLPAVIISDRDPRFTGRFWQELWRLLDTRLNMSTAGHPQTDGKAENRQRTANTMLRHYVDFEQSDWDTQLEHAAHAINNTRSVSSGLTPFEVMFRRAPRLPLDVALRPPAQAARASEVPAAVSFLQRHRYIWDAAKQNLLKAQADQKRYADRHRREETFAVGDDVLLSTRDLRLLESKERAAKLTARFVGPFKVTEVINDNAYKLDLPAALRVHPVQNVSKLRRYRLSPPRFAGRPAADNRPPPECTDPAGDEVYEVERVLAQRGSSRRPEYLIKWKGYPNEDASWVSGSALDCSDLLAEFRQRQGLDDEE